MMFNKMHVQKLNSLKKNEALGQEQWPEQLGDIVREMG